MKWTRHLCQAAPESTAEIAPLSPSWASLTTSFTPESPRATRPLRNWVQKAPSSLGPTSRPRISLSPRRPDPYGDHHRLGDDP